MTDEQLPSEQEPELPDPDRAAILRRRNRFITLALSGLAAGATVGCPKPEPCLSPPPDKTEHRTEDKTEKTEEKTEDKTEEKTEDKTAEKTPEKTRPTVCLKMAPRDE